jgi:ABC-2 type transport system permease protein
MFKLVKHFFWVSQLRKDFLVDFSYKITFFGQFFGIILTAISFFFISETFFGFKSEHLELFNYDYFMFAVIGIAILDIVITIMRSLTTLLRESQTFGYVEVLFISNINPLYLFICSAIYPFLKGIIKFVLYVALLKLFGDHSFSFVSILLSFLLFLVMIIPFLGISFLALSFVLYFKQADPINFFIQTLVSIFSGIIYPVSVLPPFMQNISDFIPLTLQLNSARSILINNSIDNYIFSTLFFTHIFFSILFLFACMQVFKITIFLSKEKGTIGNY